MDNENKKQELLRFKEGIYEDKDLLGQPLYSVAPNVSLEVRYTVLNISEEGKLTVHDHLDDSRKNFDYKRYNILDESNHPELLVHDNRTSQDKTLNLKDYQINAAHHISKFEQDLFQNDRFILLQNQHDLRVNLYSTNEQGELKYIDGPHAGKTINVTNEFIESHNIVAPNDNRFSEIKTTLNETTKSPLLEQSINISFGITDPIQYHRLRNKIKEHNFAAMRPEYNEDISNQIFSPVNQENNFQKEASHFSEKELTTAMSNIQFDKDDINKINQLMELKSSGKEISPEQKKLVLNSDLSNEHKIALLTFMNDKNPKQTIMSHMKETSTNLSDNLQKKAEDLTKNKGKGKGIGNAANTIEKISTRLHVD